MFIFDPNDKHFTSNLNYLSRTGKLTIFVVVDGEPEQVSLVKVDGGQLVYHNGLAAKAVPLTEVNSVCGF
jgi:hypothetical protein